MVAVVLFSVTPVTARFTVTLHVPWNPSTVVAVMTAVPGVVPAVTSPVLDTVATNGLLLLHETLLFVAPVGETVAVSC